MGGLINCEKEILSYYNNGAEIGRLERGIGVIEFERTKEIISRYLSKNKQVIYDIGGGIGVYSNWLSNLGHEVHLFELSPKAVEYAKEADKANINPITSIEISDARNIDRTDKSADIVLLMGPLYHLTDKEERIKALKEAFRVLKDDGTLIATSISRYGNILWSLSVYGEKNNILNEDEFMNMIKREILSGQHIRPDKYPSFIARSFFHLPSQLKNEIEFSGFVHEKNIAVEGSVWLTPSFEEKWYDENRRAKLLELSTLVEEQEYIMGLSPHVIAIARKKGRESHKKSSIQKF